MFLLAVIILPLFFRPLLSRWQRAAAEQVAEAIFPYYVWRTQQDGFQIDRIVMEVTNEDLICPSSFKLIADGNGTVRFEGKGSFIKTHGSVTASLSNEQLEKLAALVLATRYFSIPDHPPPGTLCATDGVRIATTVEAGSQKRSIDDRCIRNADLQRFEEKFLDIVDAGQWLGSQEEQKKLDQDCLSQFQ